MRLSVIVPVHNAENTIERCLNSLLDQGVSSYEIICVENGSVDKSACLLDRYASRYKDIIKVCSIVEASVSAARNKGLELALGEVVAFCDADDYVIPNAYKYLLDNYWTENVDLLKFNSITLDSYVMEGWCERNDVSGEVFYEGTTHGYVAAFNRVPNFVWAHLYRRSLLVERALLFEPLVIGEDSLFNLRVYMENVKMVAVSSNIYRYTVCVGQVTRDRNVAKMKKVSSMYVELLGAIIGYMGRYPDLRNSLQEFLEIELVSFLSRTLSAAFSKNEYDGFVDRLKGIGLLRLDGHTKQFAFLKFAMSCYPIYLMTGFVFRKVFVPYVLPRLHRN